jgi:MerR family transcriptional regulator, light-induced transcriptional regulator
MQQFSIKDMERLSGIKAHTLRIWEYRYGILQPLRKDGNHRFYSNEDLKTLLRVVFLYEKGKRIGDIARLSPNEIQQILADDQLNGSSVRANIIAMTEAVLDFDEEAMDKIYQRITRQYGFSGGMLEVIFPLLNSLGILWMSDRLLPGQEHFASNFVLRKILNAHKEIERSPVKKPGLIMLFSPPGEFHEIGLLFMNYLLRLNGYKTVYIGTNTHYDTVKIYYEKRQPTHLFLHLTSNLQEEPPEEYLGLLVRGFPDAKVVVGGRVAQEIPDFPGCHLLRNGIDLLQFSRHLQVES